MRTAIIVVAVVVVVAIIILIVVGIIVCIRKNKLSVCKKEDTARHTEEARGAPPITCSRSSSLRRNSITSADGQLPSTWLKDLKDKIEYNIEITEEVNTGVHALSKLYRYLWLAVHWEFFEVNIFKMNFEKGHILAIGKYSPCSWHICMKHCFILILNLNLSKAQIYQSTNLKHHNSFYSKTNGNRLAVLLNFETTHACI